MTIDTTIQTLVRECAPPGFVNDEPEAFEYVCSLFQSVMCEPAPDIDQLVPLAAQFFDDKAAAQTLVERIVDQLNLAETNTKMTQSDGSLIQKSSAYPSAELPEHSTESPSGDSIIPPSTSKSYERRVRRQARKEERARRRQQKDISKPQQEFVDDDVSAWEERQASGQAWGGRGHGGRGVRGDVNTYTNIHLTNVTLNFAGNELLQNSTIQINGGHRYGLIGRNGVGKTTLLNRLASKAIPGMPKEMTILLVKQQVDGGPETPMEALLNADHQRVQLLREQSRLEKQMEQAVSNSDIERLAQRLSHLAVELYAIDADRAEERAREILLGLGFGELMEIPTEQMSGGWRMRLAFAHALFVPSDLLLLDEPTNHLDLHALLWLTRYLNTSEHTAVITSHDRCFLDEVCTDIISLEHKKLFYFPGTYSAYSQSMEEKLARDTQILEASEKQRAKAKAFIEKHEASARKKGHDPKKQRQAKMVKTKKLDRIGSYRDDGKRFKQFSLAKLSESHIRTAQKVHIEIDEPVLKMNFPDPIFAKGMNSLLRFEDVSFGYFASKRPLLKSLVLDLNRSSKVALCGRNGSGKSTLLKLITGELKPLDRSYAFNGDIWRHPSVRIGHVNQYSIEMLDAFASQTVVDYAKETIRSGRACSSVLEKASGNIRQYLGAFGLGGDLAHRLIGSLSGGEKMRLCFATVLAEQPQLLVLDEPTNHLDLETLDSLSAALHAYMGAVVIVSHNQGFLSRFCKELWVVDGGSVDVRHSDTESFDEMFLDYKKEILTGARSRSSKRHAKSTMVKRARQQRAATKESVGLIP